MSSGIKVVFLGPQSGGKTSIINRVVYGGFQESYMGTVGIDFSTHERKVDENRTALLQIWDTAGQERFYSIIPAYIRTALGVFLVFDLTDSESFNSMRSWYQLVMQETSGDPVLLVVGNKADLCDERAVSREEGMTFASSVHAEYFEVSAREGTGVHECVNAMARTLVDRRGALAIVEAPTAKVGLGSSGDKVAKDGSLLPPCGVCY